MVQDVKFPDYDEYVRALIRKHIEQRRTLPTKADIKAYETEAYRQLVPAGMYVSPFTGNVHIGGMGSVYTPEMAISDISHESLHTTGTKLREPGTQVPLDVLFEPYYNIAIPESESGIPQRLIERLERSTPEYSAAMAHAVRAQLAMRRGQK